MGETLNCTLERPSDPGREALSGHFSPLSALTLSSSGHKGRRRDSYRSQKWEPETTAPGQVSSYAFFHQTHAKYSTVRCLFKTREKAGRMNQTEFGT